MSMLTLNTISRMEDLLGRLPAVRERTVHVYAEALSGRRAVEADWEPVFRFLREAERPADEMVVFEEAARRIAAGERLSSEDLGGMLEVIEGVALDLREGLLHAAPHDEELDEDFVALRDAFLQYGDEAEDRERHLAVIRDFIYQSPGHFLREIYRRLRGHGALQVSYATLCQYVEVLAQQGEILTIGKHQGIPRYCFPHPDKVKREEYFGRPFPIIGNIQADLSDRFTLSTTFAKVYLVNNAMRTIAMVAPMSAPLGAHDHVEGSGRIQGRDYLSSRLHMETTDGLPEGVDEVVHIEILRRGEGEGEDIKIPEPFRRLGTHSVMTGVTQ